MKEIRFMVIHKTGPGTSGELRSETSDIYIFNLFNLSYYINKFSITFPHFAYIGDLLRTRAILDSLFQFDDLGAVQS